MTVCDRCGAALVNGVCAKCLLSREVAPFAGLLLEDELGRGGMGSVFRATDVATGEAVAVKFLAPELAKDPEVRARFEREAKALSLLDHPNIVRTRRSGQEDGEAYLVMELVEGGPVSRASPMLPDAAVKIAIDVARALSYAHGKGVIHRDIKPENVLRSADGTVKVTDFGIARLMAPEHRGHTVTKSDVAVGSQGFMAPEVLKGAAPDPRMDVYGVGALIRSLVTGRAPVGEVSELPSGLAQLVRKAMAENPADRFATMTEFQRALEHALPWLDRTQLPPDERLWLRAVALVLTAALGTALWALVLSLTPKILEPNEQVPLISIAAEKLPDGRLLSRVRFEPAPFLMALVVGGLALGAYGMLRRHWRLEGLDQPKPEQPVPESRIVFGVGVVACLLYATRKTLEAAHLFAPSAPGARAYVPLFGGALETIALYFFFIALLEMKRTSRPYSSERLLLFGMAIALIPPVTDMIQSLLQT
ncbi:MAG: serine/threonine protein kinase [Myxococcaceae bacterium]